MKLKLKLGLIIIAIAQLASLCSIFLGIVGGFERAEGGGFAEQTREVEFLKINNTERDEKPNIDPANIPNKVVLMIIDALRLDMMTPDNFPFLLGNLKKTFRSTGILEYQVTVDSPTVTLPRVKTLLTGKAPTYLDVLRNFQTTDTAYTATTQINQDNLIWSLKKEKPELNICFFGDETWLRLFPIDQEGKSSYFLKWEGVTSFFVKDFYEVDQNVTRNLEGVEDCNFLILHYLGLDHIGHVYGPQARPDLIRDKLTEMDRVIQKLHTELTSKGSAKNLMLVTGDHGMANAGGHGGSSFEEVTTPLIAMVTRSTLHQNQKPIKSSIRQVDLAPTLASLWGLKVPKESRGQLILDIVEQFQSSKQLAMSYQENCKHLLNILGDTREGSTYQLWWNEISKMEKPLSIKKYIELEQELGAALLSLREERNSLTSSFGTGIFVLVICEMILLCLIVNSVSKSCKGINSAVILSILPPLLIYFSSSFIEEEHYIRYFLYSGILILWFIGFGHPTDQTCFWMVIKILALHRLAMTLNQTGDKWSHLPDFNDMIVQWNLSWLSSMIGIVLIYFYCRNGDSQRNSFSFSLAAVLIIKLAGTIFSEQKYFMDVWFLRNLEDHIIQQLSYIFIIFNILYTYFKLKSLSTSIVTTVVLLVINLHRLQNFIVSGLVVAQLFQMNKLFEYQSSLKIDLKKSSKGRNAILNQVVLVWFAHASFFYQGNSNGLATIDVSAGYVGFGSFSSSSIIALLIFVNTYGSPLIIFLSSLCYNRLQPSDYQAENKENGAVGNHSKSKKKTVGTISNTLPLIFLLANGAEAIVYAFTLIAFQNHLFIWSVFVPKLMYLIAQTVMYLSLCVITLVVL